MSSDTDLWAQMCAGDSTALTQLHRRYADRLYTFCFRQTGSWALAEDLAAVVWLEAWRNRSKVQVHETDSLAPWLFGIARNVVRNSKRLQRRHQQALERLPRGVDEPDHADAVARHVDDERTMVALLSSIKQLPRGEREVLALMSWAGLNQSEIATALGISVGTVKSRLSRARHRLRQEDPSAPPASDQVSALSVPLSQGARND